MTSGISRTIGSDATSIPTPAPRISLIVMAYNEAASVGDVLREIDATLAPSSLSYEVLVVDDGSRDGTGEIADVIAGTLPAMRVLHHDGNRGIGEVYRTGFAAARGELLTFLPADGQFPPEIIVRFAALMEQADLVIGYLPDVRRSLPARILSGCERLLYRLMFGRLPRFQGIMMFPRPLLAELHVQPGGRGWGVLMEIVVKAVRAGKRVLSAPTALRPRASGESKVNNLRSVWANLKQAAVLRIKLGPR